MFSNPNKLLLTHLAVFRGEFWSVKLIETRDLFQYLKERETLERPQKLKQKNSKSEVKSIETKHLILKNKNHWQITDLTETNRNKN